MFSIKEFVKSTLIEGIKNGVFAKEYASVLAINYFSKGLLVESDVADVAETEKIETTIEPVINPDNIVLDTPITEEVVQE